METNHGGLNFCIDSSVKNPVFLSMCCANVVFRSIQNFRNSGEGKIAGKVK